MFYVYVVKNETAGKIYTGQTGNLKGRLERHNRKLPSKARSYTRRNKGLWKLVYKEGFTTREEAIKREKELKSYRGRQFVKSKIEGA